MSIVTWILQNGFLLGPVMLVGVMAASAFVWLGWARLEAHVAGRQARTGFGESAADLDDLTDGDLVTLAGKLEVVAGAPQRPDDGAPVAVITIATSRRRFAFVAPEVPFDVSVRAEVLAVKVAGERVVLDGPIALRAGSREWWPGVPLGQLAGPVNERLSQLELAQSDWAAMAGYLGVFRSVADGAPVAVRGVVRQLSDDAIRSSSYRSAAHRWQLSPKGERPLSMLPARGPSFAAPLSRVLRAPTVLGTGLAALALLYLGAYSFTGEEIDCLKGSGCANQGRCLATVQSLLPPRTACVAAGRDSCERSDGCGVLGRCSLQEGRCAAATDADCKGSRACRDNGHCSAADGECSALTDDDCAGSRKCRDSGYCLARKGECVQSAAKRCLADMSCREHGRCTNLDGVCVVGGPEDCARSAGCEQYGLCSPSRAEDGGMSRCEAADDDDCAESRSCASAGRCSAAEGECSAGSDADCAKSYACRGQQLCLARDGKCVDARGRDICMRSAPCARDGRCTSSSRGCVVSSDADCGRSTTCQQLGHCSLSGDSCVARSDEDCAQADVCTIQGACLAVEGVCTSHDWR